MQLPPEHLLEMFLSPTMFQLHLYCPPFFFKLWLFVSIAQNKQRK